ncbi:periplasmic binding protein/LacI transcriptional regulator [Nitratireductor indicus C115]|uniref:Periplasmic binding protein/LacI transcriptional regulator n=1 Tax=Nitratireductor indicus C115 TaxID=1231190 RepID=K2NZB5_9HYPH|nr:sugar ABC transporter substrate-binding protein [Nitratireductor indicus]EKF43254.1 periplasmic binding protein/LacI transcriptional regulator [Nitratireductor indicus C115]SFQ54123.1 fructose transport system substrate-binding protein [Nitratireductor indicus]
MNKTKLGIAVLFSAVAFAPLNAQAADISACLITKTDTNPFYVAMKNGAMQKAEELGVELKTYAGRIDGDSESQVSAIEACIADGVNGIMLTPSDTRGIVPTVKKAQDAGILVLALDTPLDPIDAADGTFATDNFAAGEAIGTWAKASLGDDAANAKIGLLNGLVSQSSVGVLRNQGFLTGFGIDLEDPNKWGDETDSRIVGNDVSQGSEQGGRTGMENLLQIDPMINLVYAINEPAAAGAYEALKALGREGDVMVVAVDGGCPGVKNVKEGVINATAQQYPLRMASHGVEAIVEWAKNGTKPQKTEGKDFFDTGVNLVTEEPVDGLESINSEEAAKICWG